MEVALWVVIVGVPALEGKEEGRDEAKESTGRPGEEVVEHEETAAAAGLWAESEPLEEREE